MDYSIVMPVFNREDLTQACLATLLPTLEGAGDGEVIVIDNGSRPETASVLRRFPWVRVIRNETNLGFAVACNQGARAAAGRNICHLNNDIIAQPHWLANMTARLELDVGIVGARLFFPNETIQHAGVAMYPVRFGPEGFGPYHLYWGWPRETPVTEEPAAFDIVTGACLLTPRALFLQLGGFDEAFWNGYEDVDYCLRVRDRGMRVLYEPSAMLYHYESQSGVQRKRMLMHNLKTLGNRWAARIDPDHNRYWARTGVIRREYFSDRQRSMSNYPLPATTFVVHGEAIADQGSFMQSLTNNRLRAQRFVWLAQGQAPAGFDIPEAKTAMGTLRALLDERGDRYTVFVNTQTILQAGWFDDLANAIEYGSDVVAATVVPEITPDVVEPCASDARCTLLNLRDLPAHIRFGVCDTIDGAIVDLTLQAGRHGLGVRAVRNSSVELSAPIADNAFFSRIGLDHDVLRRADTERLETMCGDSTPQTTLASIVMLSWNAPQYTKMAIDSIRAHTRSQYEIVLIDNGSGAETLAMLRTLSDVRIIYNTTNKGFAHGCNQGIAAARGTHIVLLNNDVVVTEGWLENLLAAHQRDPLVGVSAPRSNRIVGHQQLDFCGYDSIETMHAFAAERTRQLAATHYHTNRAIGFCLCISRAVIDEIGGIDTRYGVGNFEDDDFCIRVRAAGYQIVVCQDVFVHHFGSVSFAANNVDYMSQMQRNWLLFAERWGLPAEYPAAGYNALPAIAQGFSRSRDYVALPKVRPHEDTNCQGDASYDRRRLYRTAFVAVVDGEASWSRVGPIVANYIKALSIDDSALFAIGVTGGADAAMIGARIARSIDRLKVDELRVADIDVADIDIPNIEEWLAAIPATSRLRVAKDDRLAELVFAGDRSPSGLLRTVRGGGR